MSTDRHLGYDQRQLVERTMELVALGRGVHESPIGGDFQARKGPSSPKKIGGEKVFASSERVRGIEGAVGGTVDVYASGWVDVLEKGASPRVVLQHIRNEGLLSTGPSWTGK